MNDVFAVTLSKEAEDNILAAFDGFCDGDLSRMLENAGAELEKGADAYRQFLNTVQAAMTRPSVLLRVVPYQDGNKWIVCHGDNLQVGIVGGGDSPAEAALDFDRMWNTTVTVTPLVSQ